MVFIGKLACILSDSMRVGLFSPSASCEHWVLIPVEMIHQIEYAK
jgi:hypothetical protein